VVVVPNADIFTSRIINNTADPVRRGSVELFIGYENDLKKAAAVIAEATRSAPGVLGEPPASVRVRDLGQDDVVVESRFWTDSRCADFLATTSAVREAIVVELKRAGVGLPDPDARFIVPRHPEQWRAAFARTEDGTDGSNKRTV
jgi:small-conductance mechanosensitive channel